MKKPHKLLFFLTLAVCCSFFCTGCMNAAQRKSVHQELLTVEQYGKALALRDFTLAEQATLGQSIVALVRSVLEDLGMEDENNAK